MDETFGEGWAELQPDGSIKGETGFHGVSVGCSARLTS